MRVVKAYGQEEHEARRLGRTIHNIRKYLMKTTRSRASVGPVWEAMTGVGLAAVILYGGWQGIYGDVSLGHFMGFIVAVCAGLIVWRLPILRGRSNMESVASREAAFIANNWVLLGLLTFIAVATIFPKISE